MNLSPGERIAGACDVNGVAAENEGDGAAPPIGVFDSGVGGLTVLQALVKALPHRDFIYVGDTARVPYGRKPREMVKQFATGIVRFLERQNVEAVVVACNTASAAALPQLADESSIPVWGVIEPGVAAARAATRTGSVGVIGTKGTVRSGVYQSKLEAAGLRVWAKACPMFVHLVEEGLADSPEADLLIRFYLEDRPEMDALILGCTHYPVLRAAIQRVVGNSVHLIDSAQSMARTVESYVVNQSPAPHTTRQGRVTHYVTGDLLAYQHTAAVIGGVEGETLSLPVALLET